MYMPNKIRYIHEGSQLQFVRTGNRLVRCSIPVRVALKHNKFMDCTSPFELLKVLRLRHGSSTLCVVP
jgi:hypothetical protein